MSRHGRVIGRRGLCLKRNPTRATRPFRSASRWSVRSIGASRPDEAGDATMRMRGPCVMLGPGRGRGPCDAGTRTWSRVFGAGRSSPSSRACSASGQCRAQPHTWSPDTGLASAGAHSSATPSVRNAAGRSAEARRSLGHRVDNRCRGALHHAGCGARRCLDVEAQRASLQRRGGPRGRSTASRFAMGRLLGRPCHSGQSVTIGTSSAATT